MRTIAFSIFFLLVGIGIGLLLEKKAIAQTEHPAISSFASLREPLPEGLSVSQDTASALRFVRRDLIDQAAREVLGTERASLVHIDFELALDKQSEDVIYAGGFEIEMYSTGIPISAEEIDSLKKRLLQKATNFLKGVSP